ncbi:MAG TPA: hypothetical protein VGD56_09440 [Gemmatirosa sp.]
MHTLVRTTATALLLVAAGCSSDRVTSPVATGFLGGTSTDREIGVVVNSTGHALTLFQLGSPTTTRTVPLGSSTTVTPVGFSLRGHTAAVPLGDAASVALVDLAAGSVTRFFTFPSGNATGSAWVDDSTLIAANTNSNLVGRIRTGQSGDAIATTVNVATSPTAVAVAAGRAFVVSGLLDANYAPTGPSVVTAIDPATMTVVGTVQTGGTNATDIAVGPDGNLYVVNTGDYVNPGSLTIINPTTLAVVATIPGMGVGPGAITIDASGLAYISSFSGGTLVWNTATRRFVRGPSNPVCAPIGTTGTCRGASSAAATSNGTLYQTFFGSATPALAPQVFVYTAGTFALRDSVAVGAGPAAIQIRTF